MANDTVILSPEYVGVGRREAKAVGSTIPTGAFVEAVSGGFQVATPAVSGMQVMITTENISTAQELDYVYSIGENVYANIPPRGCRVNAKAVAATYNAGDVVEVGAGGLVQAVTTNQAIGVVPADGGEIISAGGSLAIDLL